MDGTNLMRLAELLKMAGKPSHGYTISEAGPEVVTAPGVYFPSKPGEVIPLQSRAEGGPVSSTSSSSDTEKEKLAILRDIISVIKPRQDHGGQGLESRQMGGPVSPDGKPSLMDEIEKSKYDIFKAAMSVLKPQPQKPYNERTSTYGSPPGKSQFSPSLPTTPSLPSLPKPITSSSYGMMPDAFKPSEGEALWQKKRSELGWENPGEDLWTHKRKEAGVLDLTSRQYGGFVSPDEEELKARKKWEIPSYPERRLEEVRNILGPSVLGVQPGFQESYYEVHPEEKLMDEEMARMKPLTDAIMKSIEDTRTREQGYGLGFGPTPAERRLGAGRGREQPSEIPGLITAGGLLAPKLTKGILPTGVKTPSLTAQTETNEDKYSVSMYNKMFRDLNDAEKQTVLTRVEGLRPPKNQTPFIDPKGNTILVDTSSPDAQKIITEGKLKPSPLVAAEERAKIWSIVPNAITGAYFDKTDSKWKVDTSEGVKILTGEEQRQLGLQTKEEAPTERTKTMKQLAPRVLQLAERVQTDLTSQIQNLGPAVGRWNAFWTGKVGSPNPGFKKLQTDVGLLSTLLMNMHVGARGGEMMIQRFEHMLDTGKQSPENMAAALSTIIDYAKETAQPIVGQPIPIPPVPTGGGEKPKGRVIKLSNGKEIIVED